MRREGKQVELKPVQEEEDRPFRYWRDQRSRGKS
jgi:hypothetical protein